MISIDLGSYETKIIEGKVNRDGIKVNKAFSFDTPKNSYKNGYIKNEEELINKTKEELKKNRLTSGNCYINIKSTAVITREIVFPLLGDKEIEGLLKYQLPEYLPMDSGKYIIQHKPLDKINVEGSEKLNVLVVAIPREMVDAHFSFIKELGLRPTIMDYQCNALWKLLKHSNKINDDISIADRTIAAIDLGYDTTSITIIKNGIMQFSRVLDIGGFNMDSNLSSLISLENEELLAKKMEITDVSIIDGGYSDYNRMINIIKTSLEGIMERADKVFKYYIFKETENEIQNIILYGGLSGIKGIDKLFNGYFNVSTSIINDLDKINTQNDVKKYINCFGALLRDDEVYY